MRHEQRGPSLPSWSTALSVAGVLLLCAGTTAACDTTDDAVAKAKDATKTAQDAANKGKDAADKAVDTTKDAIDASKKAVDEARNLWDGVPSTGELSAKATAWIDGEGGTIGDIIAKGKQVAPVALEIGKVLASAIESDRMVEPIFQKVPEGKEGEVDAAIKEMPRTEVIDGLTIGFKQLDETASDKVVKERGYLVTWREGDRLIGFVYRSKSTVDVDKLVAETPRLVKLTKSAVAAE